MKQTNNAIKFLMAQYRAVFKSAYVSGITTAVALTSFLAAAQANAAQTELKVDNWDKALEASETLVINGETTTDPAKGEYSKLNITSAENKTLTLSEKQKLSLVGNKVSDAKISATGKGNTLSLTGEGALEVDAKNGLTLESSASGATLNVDLGSVNIKNGNVTLNASDADATVNLAANSIVIGNGESGDGATVTLSGSGKNVLGGTSSSIVVKGNGKVETKGTKDNTIQGSSLVAEKGSKFSFAGVTNYKVQSSTFTSSTIDVAAGGTLNVDLAEIGTGKPGQMTITGAEKETSKVNVGGALNIKTGVVNIDKHVELKSNASGTNDKIVIGDGQQASKFDKAVFKIGKDTLLGYLDKNGTNKGSVDLKSGGVLYITDEVNLKDLTFSDQTTDGAISQGATTGGALGGSNIVITEAVQNATHLDVKADKLTFGDKEKDKDKNFDFATGVGNLEAKNVEFAGKSVTLNETVKLRNVAFADDKVTAGEGKVSGNVIIGKSNATGGLEVDGGKFNYTSGDMTLTSGAITVQNSLADSGGVSSLTFDKDTKIIVTGSTAAAFTAKATGKGSVLDISKAKLEASGSDSNQTVFSAEDEGRLVISNEQVKAVAEAKTNPLQSVQFKAGEKGTLAFSDAVTLELGTGKNNPISVADIAAAGTGLTIGGTLEANSGLTINYTGDAGTNAHYAVSGTLVASTLTLSAKKSGTDAYFKLGDGVYKLSSGLAAPDSAKDKFVVISGSNNTDHEKSTLLLGAVSTNEKGELVTSKGGSATNIEVQTNGVVGVESGEWNGKKLQVTNGSFTIGYKDNTGDKTANAAFNGTDLTVANANTFTINRGSSAKFETVSGGAASAIKVDGSLTITGKEKTNPITAASGQTGIVVMGANSEVTLGTEAVKNAITKVSGDTVDFSSSFAADLFTMGKNATFTLDLGVLAEKDKTITISATGLNKLKDQLFAGYNSGTNTQIDGFLHIGKADIAGLTISDDKVAWTDYKNFQDTISSVTSDKLSKATVTDVDGTSFKGSVGAVALKNGTNTLTVDGNTILANASGNSGFFVSKGTDAGAITISGENVLTLSGGGKAGAITLKNGNATDKTTLVVTSKDGAPVTELAGIAGQNGSSPAADHNAVQIVGKTKVNGEIKDIVDLEIGSELEVTNNVTVKNLKSLASKGVALKMEGKDLTVSEEANFAGDITAKNATFSKTGAEPTEGTYDAKLGGNNTIETLSFTGHGMINNGGTTKVTKKLTVASGNSITVAQSATLDAKHIDLTAKGTATTNTQLIVGQDSRTAKKNGIDIAIGSSTGYLVANTVKLNGGDLIADPDFGGAASIVSVAGFGAANTDLTKNAGTIDGKAIALQNSILAIGVKKEDKTLEKLQDLFADYLDPKTGSLSSEGYGSIMYVAKNVTVGAVGATDSKLIIDPKRGLEKYNKDLGNTGGDQAYKDAVNDNAAYIGEGAALAVSADAAVHSFDEANKAQNAAIKFNKQNASVYAEKNSTVLLTGDFSSMDNIKLFADTDTGTNAGGVMINGNDLKATTLSGVYEFIMTKGKQTDANGFQLNVNNDVLDKSYHDASHPARNTIVAYAKKEFANGTKLHGDFVAGVTFDAQASQYKKTDGTVLTGDDIKNYMHIGDKVYTKVNNRFLENITQNLNYGHDVDTITRLGAYSGVAHSAIAAGNVTTNAVAARFAIGSSPVDFIAAQNNMGGSAFVAPMMNQFESDGFDSEGVSYGVDVDTTGVAFGGDFEFTPQLRAGVLFNIGSGDAKGKGQASTASSDFDFYGLSVYAGYNVDRFAVVADVSYTKIDNEVKAFITDETIKADSSATNMSLGVNAQYTFDFNQMAVTPHMGLRYSMIEADDYSITDAGSFSSDKMSVISVPVGVTIAQAYASENWIVTPYADFTVTGNFGDNSYKGSFKWANVANLTTDTDTEVMDNFSYGLTLGINGETGNLGMSAGLNYTSSSNTDNLGFSASCRYLF
ncbi:autotransporter outer membrane beta-barrel domain-containing protein [Anaerobiospirillum succiniciproducens]|uniref:autotransporter outer membrane beta-barrel domain-containing protein n=1 Tax=Anaerobiospirillum succiniciproducens TaxID=13335 RepID=UPI002943A18D|nr:autotransporter outer membrane beta-barrel domain-containing protein [Anaerobiospirillum succiniciproducens]